MRSDVVALYVDPRGPYPGLVEEWYDAARDGAAALISRARVFLTAKLDPTP